MKKDILAGETVTQPWNTADYSPSLTKYQEVVNFRSSLDKDTNQNNYLTKD